MDTIFQRLSLFLKFTLRILLISMVLITFLQVIPATGLPVPYTYLALPIAGMVMIIFAGELLIRLKKGDNYGFGDNYTIR